MENKDLDKVKNGIVNTAYNAFSNNILGVVGEKYSEKMNEALHGIKDEFDYAKRNILGILVDYGYDENSSNSFIEEKLGDGFEFVKKLMSDLESDKVIDVNGNVMNLIESRLEEVKENFGESVDSVKSAFEEFKTNSKASISNLLDQDIEEDKNTINFELYPRIDDKLRTEISNEFSSALNAIESDRGSNAMLYISSQMGNLGDKVREILEYKMDDIGHTIGDEIDYIVDDVVKDLYRQLDIDLERKDDFRDQLAGGVVEPEEVARKDAEYKMEERSERVEQLKFGDDNDYKNEKDSKSTYSSRRVTQLDF